MKTLINIYEAFDIIVVPFPFTDILEGKKRPAVVLSSNEFNSQARACILAMVTSSSHASWPGDVEISDLDTAGLPAKSLIRLKLFSLDHRLIIKNIGRLSNKDKKSLKKSLQKIFPLA
jgi:mRNA interferase MazF